MTGIFICKHAFFSGDLKLKFSILVIRNEMEPRQKLQTRNRKTIWMQIHFKLKNKLSNLLVAQQTIFNRFGGDL